MPDLDKLPVPQYSADQPYHWEYDNLPLKTLEQRDEIINNEVNNHSEILNSCSGTQGTLANRLAQSIDEDGNLISSAVDESAHNIAEHLDGNKEVEEDELEDYIQLGFPSLTNPVDFVRMLSVERIKLASISDNATDLKIDVEVTSDEEETEIISFESGTLKLEPSESIQWEVESPNKVKAVLRVSTEFAHRHYYNLNPVMEPTDDMVPILYKKFKVTSMSTPFVEDSLRVYINGIRLNPNDSVYHPDSSVSNWMLNGYVSDHENGIFTLTNAITELDIIQIDFDEYLN